MGFLHFIRKRPRAYILSAAVCSLYAASDQLVVGQQPTGPVIANETIPGIPVAPTRYPTASLSTYRPHYNLPVFAHLTLQRRQRLEIANADLRRAKVLWLPTLNTGVDYFRHDGRIQDVVGTLFDTSKSSFMVGVGPTAVFAVTDAVFAPLAARQVVQARDAGIQTARNDSLLAVAESYFTLQQARGDLAGAEDAARRAEEIVRRAEVLSSGGIVASVEVVRSRTEAAHRRQLCQSAWERWQTVSAELVRLLRLETATTLQPVEPPHLQMTLVPQDRTVDDLIPIGLLNRPELASHQALVQATLEQLRAEKLRPLVPSVLLRGTSTVPGGTLATGVFGGGVNGSMGNFAARGDLDLQVIWELQNLGLGNRRESKAAGPSIGWR